MAKLIQKATVFGSTGSGFTLLELIVAMTLSTLVILGLIRVFVHIKQEVARQVEIVNLFSQVQFITDYFARSMRQVGDPVCGHAIYRIMPTADFQQCVFLKGHWQRLSVHYYLRHGRLYRKIFSNKAQELARGLVKMHIHDLVDHGKIRGVCFWFLLRTTLKLWPQQRYFFDGKFYRINDNHTYFSWPIVVAFRER